MIDFPIDIVYTWVDGSDKNWLKKKNEVLIKYSDFYKTDEVSGKTRFFNRDELKYSLRSVSKFAPWVRKIFIITDNQIPVWLNINNSKIIIVDHREIFKTKHLPCFNSNAIEANIHNIEKLSDNFLSFNDDFFLGRSTDITDFFHNTGKPKLFTGKKLYNFNKKRLLTSKSIKTKNPHQYAILNARKKVYDKYGIIVNFNLLHGIKVLNKNNLIKLEMVFSEYFENTRKHQFRDNSDIWIIALDAFYSIAIGENIPYSVKPYRKNYKKYHLNVVKKKRDYVFIPLNITIDRIESKIKAIKNYSPLMFCINDYPNTDDNKYRMVKNFLSGIFKNKCEFEK